MQAGDDAAAFRKAVETHFDATMTRASGWFKRHTQNVALVASAVLVIGANVDTVELATSLAERAAGLQASESRSKCCGVALLPQQLKEDLERFMKQPRPVPTTS